MIKELGYCLSVIQYVTYEHTYLWYTYTRLVRGLGNWAAVQRVAGSIPVRNNTQVLLTDNYLVCLSHKCDYLLISCNAFGISGVHRRRWLLTIRWAASSPTHLFLCPIIHKSSKQSSRVPCSSNILFSFSGPAKLSSCNQPRTVCPPKPSPSGYTSRGWERPA